jgi:hypothetical protein
VHHDPAGERGGGEHVEDVVVGVTVVDDQRAMGLAGDLDVGRERVALAGLGLGLGGTEVVEAGLPDPPDM